MLSVILPISLLTGGLAAGALLLSALGGAPMLVALPVEQYVPVHKFLVTRFDPFMPLSLATAMVCDVVVTFLAPTGPARLLAAAGALLYIAVMAVSLTKNVPINRWIAALDPADMPADWASVDPRSRWRDWNLVRTSLAVAGLVVNVSIVGVLL
ncbi:DUF1772 domain-containing protein [Sphaerisporangium sp. TRM90804]|uniref:DUF1772 domain-containing protein n=1 Tax=Sphaerisporangium sp. TRM90804 TaxID=3031113 RepID=UPI0024472265|nr:DUF1772 domain-containing protein [Sphaerisporangium sp. TRM90804]MDH2427230.1 DUF1772 domain-containing protein [Sphaerisporangium sp. TRM90804]